MPLQYVFGPSGTWQLSFRSLQACIWIESVPLGGRRRKNRRRGFRAPGRVVVTDSGNLAVSVLLGKGSEGNEGGRISGALGVRTRIDCGA